MTWGGFLALPYETRNAALINGEVVTCPPDAEHEFILQNLLLAFVEWMRSGEGRGNVCTQQPVRIDDHRGYQPDFGWYPQRLCSPLDEPLSFSGPPELIVEVLSQSTRTLDMVRKRHDYERLGVGEVWFVDPNPGEQGVLAYQRERHREPFVAVEVGPGDHLTSPRLEGFELHVARLFQR